MLSIGLYVTAGGSVSVESVGSVLLSVGGITYSNREFAQSNESPATQPLKHFCLRPRFSTNSTYIITALKSCKALAKRLGHSS